MKIRFYRNYDGAVKLHEKGFCWTDSILWQLTKEEDIENIRIKKPDIKAKDYMYTLEEVGLKRNCGYCGGCDN